MSENKSKYDARIPTTKDTRDELKLLKVKSDSASSYNDLLREFIEQHAE